MYPRALVVLQSCHAEDSSLRKPSGNAFRQTSWSAEERIIFTFFPVFFLAIRGATVVPSAFRLSALPMVEEVEATVWMVDGASVGSMTTTCDGCGALTVGRRLFFSSLVSMSMSSSSLLACKTSNVSPPRFRFPRRPSMARLVSLSSCFSRRAR